MTALAAGGEGRPAWRIEKNGKKAALGEKFIFDIQFFAQERTEPATPKKRQKTRADGKVCKSKDLTAAVEIVVGLLCLWAFGYFMGTRLIGFVSETVTFIGDVNILRDGWFQQLAISAIWTYFMTWLLIGIIICVVVVGMTIWLVGWLISFKPFVPKLDRMNPISGLKKIISLRSLVELTKAVIKASIFGLLIYLALMERLPVAMSAMQLSVAAGAWLLWELIWGLAIKLAIMLLVIGIVDYAYQKWEFERSIKMSKQEVKEEHKQMEGDPLIKSKIRQKQRELAKKRMMSSVPKADVVITNPTMLAIALMYDRGVMAAPQIVAMGKGVIAKKIRELAKEHGVPIVENKPLAWALFESAEVGDEVPENLYRGVAEILAMVYKLKKKAS